MSTELEQLRLQVAEQQELIERLRKRCCAPLLHRCKLHKGDFPIRIRQDDTTKRTPKVKLVEKDAFQEMQQNKPNDLVIVKSTRVTDFTNLELTEDNLMPLKLKDLKMICKERKFKGFSKVKTKEELVYFILERAQQ